MSKETEIKRLKYQIELMKCCDNCELDAVSCAGEATQEQRTLCTECNSDTLSSWTMINKNRIPRLQRIEEQYKMK